ncbi:MAG: transglycosylase domain-containing protein, partial [Afipia sp.]|nr:transglycosylase domain-containing protein [Afipia sp.]
MALGRKKKSGRKEPKFDGAASLDGIRLNPWDRVGGPEDDEDVKPKRRAAKSRPADEDEDGDPRETRPRKTRAAARKDNKTKAKGRSRSGLGRVVYWGAVLGLWAIIASAGVIVWVSAQLPPIQSLEIPKRPPTIQITGMDGTVIATRGEMPGANVSLKDLPPHLPKAFIAIEDRRFYSHFGLDPTGIARAAFANLMHRGVSQGGSTLSQQLAKNLFQTQERNFQRKLQEFELALWLERK